MKMDIQTPTARIFMAQWEARFGNLPELGASVLAEFAEETDPDLWRPLLDFASSSGYSQQKKPLLAELTRARHAVIRERSATKRSASSSAPPANAAANNEVDIILAAAKTGGPPPPPPPHPRGPPTLRLAGHLRQRRLEHGGAKQLASRRPQESGRRRSRGRRRRPSGERLLGEVGHGRN